MTTTMTNVNPSLLVRGSIDMVYNNQGIDSIRGMTTTTTVINQAKKLGLKEIEDVYNTKTIGKVAKTLRDEALRVLKQEKLKNSKKRAKRYNMANVEPKVRAWKLSKGSTIDTFMIVVIYTAETMDYLPHHKKPKGHFCKVHFVGLHQPSKKLHAQTMAMVYKFLDRKKLIVQSIDIATDVVDSTPLKTKRKEALIALLWGYSEKGQSSLGKESYRSFYLNYIKKHGSNVSKIHVYDKYLKQLKSQGRKKIAEKLKKWKRVEVTLTFDLSKKENRKSFKEYVNSNQFLNDVVEVNEIVATINNQGHEHHYLEYQLSSFVDGRTMNNQESKKQFNSLESLERFKASDYRRYSLPV